ncbi:MAG: enoyl-CoA hydratase [Chloroflexi bacterium]|nr:MAG: enoyl-CoA hydratase [Chloroflexota bacterium]
MQTLVVERQESIVTLALNRPEVRNAINNSMIEELIEVMRELDGDDDVRAAVVTSTSEQAFCTGMDLKERKDISEAALVRQRRRMVEMFGAIRNAQRPLVAAVCGYALGGGLEIALNCDFIVAAENASFGMPEVSRGIMPGGGGTQLLPQRIGAARARELIYTGDVIDAPRALQWGMVNHVVAAPEVLPTALAIARKIADNGPIGVRQAKRAINFNQSLEEGVRFEAEAYLRVLFSEDRREGFAAFNERRRAVYKGK